jgi:copper chaperone
MATSEYRVSGMSCAHCEAGVQTEVAQIPGVDGVTVSADTGRLVVTSALLIAADAVLGAVERGRLCGRLGRMSTAPRHLADSTAPDTTDSAATSKTP